jgi:hypothetical protein
MNKVIYDEALQFLNMKQAVNETLNILSMKDEAVALNAKSKVVSYLHFSKTVVNCMQTSATSINCNFFKSESQSTELQFFIFFLIVERYNEEKKTEEFIETIIKKNDTLTKYRQILKDTSTLLDIIYYSF